MNGQNSIDPVSPRPCREKVRPRISVYLCRRPRPALKRRNARRFRHFGTVCLLSTIVACNSKDAAPPPNTTAPTPGDAGRTQIREITDRSVTVAWTKATDDATSQQSLTYCMSARLSLWERVSPTWHCERDVSSMSIIGLRKATVYDFDIVVADQAGNAVRYDSAHAETLRVLPPSLSEERIANSYGLFPTVWDFDNDGWLETLGTANDGSGKLLTVDPGEIGLGTLRSEGRIRRDARAVDLNADNQVDIVANTYSEYDALESFARLYLGNGDGTFIEDNNFAALGIRGFGETILAADFNNDSHLDLYLPYYSQYFAEEHSYLLVNNGDGNFVDVADSAGVALRGRPEALRVEGAHAVDFNTDGWIDFYVGGHLFINNGDLTFSDMREAWGLPELFDEGARFVDWNNDGLFDLVLHHPSLGPRLFTFDGRGFSQSDVIPPFPYNSSYGMNAADLNNDGLEDIVTAGGRLFDTVVLLNNGKAFERGSTAIDGWGNDSLAFADFDEDGDLDIIKREVPYFRYARNQLSLPAPSSFRIEVVGANGEKNQQGRVVRLTPKAHSGTILTRAVDSGSGYMAQGQYELLIGTRYPGPHEATVYFADRVVTFTIEPGQSKRVFADGVVNTLSEQ